MPTLVQDPEIIRRVQQAAGQATQSPPPPQPVTDPNVINRVRQATQMTPGQRVAGAFQAASDVPDVSITPPLRDYGFLDYLGQSLPFGDEVAAAGGAIGRQLAEVTGRARGDLSFGESYDRIKAMEKRYAEEYARDHPVLAPTAAVTGAATMGIKPGAKLPATLLGRAGQGAVVGGEAGALYGAGEGDTLAGRARDAAWSAGTGALIGGIAPAAIEAGIGVGRFLFGRTGRVAPTIASLRAEKTAAYQRVDRSGLRFSPDEFGDTLRKIVRDFKDSEFDVSVNEKAAAKLRQLFQRLDLGESLSLSRLDKIRQSVNRDVVQKGDSYFGRIMRDRLDELIDSKADPVMREARAAHRQYRMAERIDEAITDAERATEKTGSGGNIDNQLRQKLDQILKASKNPRTPLKLTPIEEQLIDRYVRGGRGGKMGVRNLLRLLGKLSPQGNGLMLVFHTVGGIASGGATLPLAAGGFVAKRAADAMAQRGARGIQQRVAAGGIPPKAPLGWLEAASPRLLTNELLAAETPYLSHGQGAGGW